MSKQAKVKPDMLVNDWSPKAIDFVNKLIQRKPNRRLGQNGIIEIKRHPWLSHFPWSYLSKQIMKPKYVPQRNVDNFNFKNVNKPDNSLDPNLYGLLKKKDIQKLFEGYHYDKKEDKRDENPIYFLTTRDSTLD